MGFSTEDITAVRALPVVLAVAPDGSWQGDPGFIEVVFESDAEGMHHQAYVDGRLAGATLLTDDRSIIVAASEHAASAVEVVAVDVDDRLTDYSASLTGYGDAQGSRATLSWSGGRYLDDALDHFDVYGGPAGAIDYAAPLNAEPIPATVSGEDLGGFGCGGFGRGGWGRSAMTFTFTTAKRFPGDWEFEVVAVDASGNATGGAEAQAAVELAGLVRPPSDFVVSGYDAQTQTATLAWTASPDVNPSGN